MADINDQNLSDLLAQVEDNNIRLLLKTANTLQNELASNPSDVQKQKAYAAVMERLAKAKAEIQGETVEKKVSQRIFTSKRDAIRYIAEIGRKCKKDKFYADAKKGLIKCEDDGTITQKSLDEYANTLPLLKAFNYAGQNAVREAEEREARRCEAEIRLKEAQAKIAERKLEIQQGKYIPKDEVWLELAARAVAIRNTLKNVFESRVMELIDFVKEGKSVEDITLWMGNVFDYALGEYAGPIEINVDFSEATEKEHKGDDDENVQVQ